MEGYKAKVVSSWKELTVKEKIAYKETDSCIYISIFQYQLLLNIMLSHFCHIQLMRPHRQWPTRLTRPWDSLGKNTGVGCHFLPMHESEK